MYDVLLTMMAHHRGVITHDHDHHIEYALLTQA
jgi:hypothetical protein